MRGPVPGPVLACLLAAVLFGASTPASKKLLDTMGPAALAGLLYLGAAAAVLPAALRRRAAASRTRSQWLRLAGAVGLGGVLAPVLLLTGLRAAPASSVSLWLNLEPAATALLAAFLFREHLGVRGGAAVALVTGAGIVLAAPGGFGLAPAAALVALACVCWGFDNNLTALIDGFTPAQTVLAKGLVAGVVDLGLGLTVGGGIHAPAAVPVALGVGALAYGLSLVLYIGGAQELGAARSQMLFAAAPFAGAGVSWAALGEPVRASQLIAAAIMSAGVLLMLTQSHAHEHAHDAIRHTHAHRHDDGHHRHVHPGIPAWTRHTHEHVHEPEIHAHPHLPDLHHRHGHGRGGG